MIVQKQEVTDKKLVNQAGLVTDYASMIWDKGKGIWDPREFREAVKGLNKETRIKTDQIEKDFASLDPETAQKVNEYAEEPTAEKRRENPVVWGLWKYFNIKDKHTDKYGKVDYDAFDTEWKEETDKWEDDKSLDNNANAFESDSLAERVEAYLAGSDNHPFIKSMYSDFDIIAKSGYWKTDFPDTMDRLTWRIEDAQDIWDEYLTASSKKKSAMKSKQSPDSRFVIKAMEEAKEINRMDIRLKDATVDAKIVLWFASNPAQAQNIPLWRRLYSSEKYPKNVELLRR
jgi:hypothetical protein